MAKYTIDERLKIGQQIYDGDITRYQASIRYNISPETARSYMRLYRDTKCLPAKTNKPPSDDFDSWPREKLIRELRTARERLEQIRNAAARKDW